MYWNCATSTIVQNAPFNINHSSTSAGSNETIYTCSPVVFLTWILGIFDIIYMCTRLVVDYTGNLAEGLFKNSQYLKVGHCLWCSVRCIALVRRWTSFCRVNCRYPLCPRDEHHKALYYTVHCFEMASNDWQYTKLLPCPWQGPFKTPANWLYCSGRQFNIANSRPDIFISILSFFFHPVQLWRALLSFLVRCISLISWQKINIALAFW